MTSTGVTGTVSKENLQEAPEFFTNMYYEEYNDFGPYWGAETVPTDGPNILHFTQMIWKNTLVQVTSSTSTVTTSSNSSPALSPRSALRSVPLPPMAAVSPMLSWACK